MDCLDTIDIESSLEKKKLVFTGNTYNKEFIAFSIISFGPFLMLIILSSIENDFNKEFLMFLLFPFFFGLILTTVKYTETKVKKLTETGNLHNNFEALKTYIFNDKMWIMGDYHEDSYIIAQTPELWIVDVMVILLFDDNTVYYATLNAKKSRGFRFPIFLPLFSLPKELKKAINQYYPN